jgi:hypothetical protein
MVTTNINPVLRNLKTEDLVYLEQQFSEMLLSLKELEKQSNDINYQSQIVDNDNNAEVYKFTSSTLDFVKDIIDGDTSNENVQFISNVFNTDESEINDLLNRLTEISQPQGFDININHKIPLVENCVNSVYNWMKPQASKENRIKDKMMDILDSFGEWDTILSILMLVFVFCMIGYRNDRKNLKIFSVLLLCTYLVYTVNYARVKGSEINKVFNENLTQAFSMLWKWFENFGKEEYSAPQGFDDHKDILVESLMLLTSGIVGYKTKTPFTVFFKDIIKTSEKHKENAGMFLISISKKLHYFFTSILNIEVLANYFEIDEMTDASISLLIEQIRNFITDGNAGLNYYEQSRSEIYTELVRTTKETLKRIDIKSYDYKALSSALVELEKQSLVLQTFQKSLSGERVEPVGIIFMGKPGVMKSALVDRVSKLVCQYTLPEAWAKEFEENAGAFIYPAPTGKFFDGYNYKCWVTLLDDLFQIRDPVGNENSEPLKVIKMINSAPYRLDNAAVELKNNTFFRSSFVVATTNLDKENFKLLESIQDYTAVERRFHLTVDVTINEKYKIDQVYNSDLLPLTELLTENGELFNATTIPDDFWDLNLTRYEGATKVNVGRISFEDLIVMAVSRYHENVKRFYVNKITNQQAYTSIKEKLDTKLKGGNRFGEWFKKKQTIFEYSMPQSGIPGSYPSFDNNSESWKASMKQAHNKNSIHVKTILSRYGVSQKILDILEPSDISLLSNGTKSIDGFISEAIENNNICGLSYGKPKTGIADKDEEFRKGVVLYMDLLFKSSEVYKYDLEFEDKIDITQTWADLFYHSAWTLTKTEYLDIVYALCSEHKMEFKGLPMLLDIFNSLDDINRLVFLDNLPHKDDFYYTMNTLFYFRDDEGVDLITGEELPWSKKIKKTCTKYIEKVTNCLGRVWKFLKEHLMIITVGLGIVAAASAAIYMYINRFFFSEPHSMDTSRNTGSKGSKKIIKLSKHIDKINYATPQGMLTHGLDLKRLPALTYDNFGCRNAANNIIASITNKYYFNMFVTADHGEGPITKRIGFCWNLVGQIFSMPFHFIYLLNNLKTQEGYIGSEITLVNPTKTNIYKLTIEDLFNNFETTDVCADTDLCAFLLHSAQLNSIGIMKYLLNDKDIKSLKNVNQFDVSLIGAFLSESNNFETISVRKVKTKGKFENTDCFFKATWSDEHDFYKIKGENIIRYNEQFSAGDCGTLLVCDSANFQNRIIMGMHIAGGDGFGQSCIITRELAEDLISIFTPYDSFIDEEIPDFLIKHVSEPHGNLKSFYIFDDYHKLSNVPYTQITRSRIYGLLPEPYNKIDSCPAKLTTFTTAEGDINPMHKAILNYGFEPPCVDQLTLMMAVGSYEQKINDATGELSGIEKRVWTLKEALHAKDSVKGIASSTSSGFPMNLKYNVDLKKEYLREFNDGNFKKSDECFLRIATEVEHLLDLYRNNIRPFFVYYDFPKDEIRSKEKVYLGLTRMVSGSPFFYLTLMRMYFGAFMDFFYKSNVDVGSAIGVNPYSDQWDQIARKLKKFGNIDGKHYVGAGDYSKFDGHEQPFSMNQILSIINDWYGLNCEEDNKIRRFLWSEITNSRHHFCNEYIEWFNSMSSGNPLTAIINTMNNNILIRCCWVEAGLNIRDFNDSTYFIALGDDNTFSVHVNYHDKFNELLLPDLMRRFGMIYTTELKGEAKVPFRELDEIEFLKRGFIFNSKAGRYVAPLRIDSICNMVNWTKKGKLRDQITVDNIATSLRELTLHGKDIYEKWYPILNKLKQEHYPGFSYTGQVYRDYQTMLTECLSLDHEWTF